jgi:hypothetical protein
MRCLFTMFMVLLANSVFAGQPYGIRLDNNGLSLIYPVMDSAGWLLTQPYPSKLYDTKDTSRITHWEDEFYAQDWSRECGATYGKRVYAGISGKIVFAGWRGPYGNTIVIYDQETRFALKYSHLSELAISAGEYVLAGKSFLGRVGNTGNSQPSACSSNPGSHLHLALFKNVADPNSRPITLTAANSGVGPTAFATAFSFTSGVELAKASDNPTVFVLQNGMKIVVSAASFESNGWNFDKNQSVYQPLKNKVYASSDLARFSQTAYLWPLRDYGLIKATNHPAVFQFDDGKKFALSYEVFSCRGLRFSEVKEVSFSERDSYLPVRDVTATGCSSNVRQSLIDFGNFARNRGFSNPDFASYYYNPNWHPDWELRSFDFRSSGQKITLLRANASSNALERYVSYTDPATNQWSGWQRVQ